MSAYGHPMEQQYSTRSFSSENSEMEIPYVIESGFYMTSFTATIFIAALVTIGVMLVTLLITLAVMLHSCQSRSSGVIELQNINDDYSYCKVHALNAELNNLEGFDFPKICRALAIQYIRGGQYARDLDSTKSVIEDYFNIVKPSDDGIDVVLMDIDEIFPSSPLSSKTNRFYNYSINDCIEEAKNLKLKVILRLYMNLQARGWPVILFSREPATLRFVTTNHLISAGFRNWCSLVMREEAEDSTKGNGYFSTQKNVIQRKGFHIKGVISSHMDVLTVPDIGMRNFKLPDPICDKLEQQMGSTDAGY